MTDIRPNSPELPRHVDPESLKVAVERANRHSEVLRLRTRAEIREFHQALRLGYENARQMVDHLDTQATR